MCTLARGRLRSFNPRRLQAMKLAPDKIAHIKAGTVVAVASAAWFALCHTIGLHPFTAGIALAGLAAGAAVEYAQRGSNALVPRLHDVSPKDFAASAAVPVACAVAWEVAVRMGAVA